MTTPDTKTPPKAINTALYWVFSKEKGIIVPICTIAGPINIDPKMGSVDFSSMSSGKIPVHVKIKKLTDRKSTRLNSSHVAISYAVFCLKKKIYNADST